MSTSRLPTSYSGLRRWLHSGASDLVLIVPARHRQAPTPIGMREGLPRWRRRMDRRRVAALARRWLLLGLSIAVAIEFLLVAVGAPGRWLWLALPLILACAGAVAGLSRPVGSVEAALLLDRQLGLSERLTTALELAPSEARPSSLGAILQGEADAAIEQSLERSRAADPSALREWLTVFLAALLLAGVLALGGTSGSHPPSTARARHTNTNGGTTTLASRKSTAAPSNSSTAHPQTGARTTTQPAKSPSGSRSSGQAAQPTESATGKGSAATPGTPLGAPTQSQRGSTTSGAGSSSHSTAGGHGTATTPTSSSSATRSATSTPTHGGTQRTGAVQSQAASKIAPGLQGAGAARSGAGTTAAGHTTTGAGHAGATPSSASAAAGATPGHATSPSNGTPSTKAKPAATAEALPIQSGYTAGRTSHSSAPADGENSGGTRAGQAQGEPAVSGEGGGAASFAFIPLTNPGLPSLDTNLLLSYFAPFASLSGLTW
jgi:hypothetical protein